MRAPSTVRAYSVFGSIRRDYRFDTRADSVSRVHDADLVRRALSPERFLAALAETDDGRAFLDGRSDEVTLGRALLDQEAALARQGLAALDRIADGPARFATVSAESFVVVDWTDAGTHPGRPIAGLHAHHEDDEAWLVLSGRLGFRFGDADREVGPGECLLVPRGVPHSYWNARAEPARYLLVMTPRIHDLIEALHRGDRTDFEQIFREHASELLVRG
jgi:mannose-6-phosphate isomerase-like protein (cupin superfamily)